MENCRLTTGMRRGTRVLILASAVLGLTLAGCGSSGADPSERMQQAREQRAAGELRAASIQLKNVLQADPEHADARLLLGKVYLEMGDGVAAEQELSRAAELGKGEAEVAYALARALRLQGKDERLLEEITVGAGWPTATRARVYAVRAQAHLALDDVQAARQAVSRAQELGGDELETRIARIRLALADDRVEPASQLAADLTEAFPQSARAWRLRAQTAMVANEPAAADEYLTRAIEHAFAPYSERLMRAQVRLSQGQYERAREDIEWLSERAPDDPRVGFAEGLLAWATGDQDAACTHFRQVAAAAPGMRNARYYAGVCHYRNGTYNQAEAHLRAAYQGGAAPQVARVLGATYLAQQRYPRAREVLRPVLQNNPDDTAALALMAELETATGNSSRAIEYLRRVAKLRPDDPSARLQLGLGLFRSGDIDAGQMVLEEALTLERGFEQAGALLIMSHIQQEEYDKALAAAESLAERQPDAPLARTLKGLVYRARGDRERAREAFEAALELDPGDPSARRALARMALEDQDAESARKHLEAILEAYPEHSETLTALAVLEARTGNPERVGPLLKRAYQSDPGALRPRLLLGRFHLSRGRPSEALEILQGEGDSIPENAEALALAAQARLVAGQPTQAIDAAERLRQLQPDSTVPYLLLARAYSATGESGQVQAQMQRILERDPDNALALIVEAQSRLYEGKLDEAREYLERVPDEARAHPAFLTARGRLAVLADNPKEARDYYRRAFEAAPSSESVTRFAAVVYALGDSERAEQLLREWVAEHPDDTDAQKALGDLYVRQGRNAEAGEAYKAVLEQNPGSVEALNNLAWILREEKPEEALGYAEHAASLQPEDPRVLDTFGMVLLENGETERAVRQLREAVSLAPNVGMLRFHLAQALVAAGRRDDARAELDRALAGNPRFAEVEEARALMEELRSTE